MNKTTVELRVNSCFKLFDQSFNRVKYFSCIADNLTAANLPTEWQIKNPSGLSYGMKAVPENEIEHVVEGYKHFMQRYLVRDCVESFALCLDELFFVLLLHGKTAQASQTLYDCLSDEEKAALKKFKWAGISYKVQALKEKFSLKLPDAHHKVLDSLKDIRHCLAHNNGIVRNIDGKEDGEGSRLFHWSVFSVFAIGTQSGKRFEIEFNKPFEEEVNVCGQLDLGNKSKSFKIGGHLYFTSAETHEIAWSLQLVGGEYIKQINKFLESTLSSTQSKIDSPA